MVGMYSQQKKNREIKTRRCYFPTMLHKYDNKEAVKTPMNEQGVSMSRNNYGQDVNDKLTGEYNGMCKSHSCGAILSNKDVGGQTF